MTTVKGTEDIKSPHGLPADLIDRLLIVRTLPYNHDEMKTIVLKRSKLEGLVLEEDALTKLADIAVKTSLRYVLQLLSPAGIIARDVNGRSEIKVEDVEECQALFLDAKRSTKVLEEHSSTFL
ncbi:unnamed protein product [Ambrosiozyma monospora]|uniref:RuvB-like helicase n=1 Tax=Ambrosiozyma monospora TaxID=43982 RepID=A0A9W6YY96_AMBMO|nr:unnamed protein product [Ambrosiozyma monospora]